MQRCLPPHDIAQSNAGGARRADVHGVVSHSVSAAVSAIEYGASAIIVSNHGGRQADYAPATIDVLAEVRRQTPGGMQGARAALRFPPPCASSPVL